MGNNVYLYGCGGNEGCTETLHMEVTDFVLVFNNKHYRFGSTDGHLSILCINGVDEKIGIQDGYKNLVITNNERKY